MSKSKEIGRQLVNDVVDDRIAGARFSTLFSDRPYLAVQRRNWKRRFLQSTTFDRLFELLGSGAALAAINTGFSRESR
jgi:hypothetical protein